MKQCVRCKKKYLFAKFREDGVCQSCVDAEIEAEKEANKRKQRRNAESVYEELAKTYKRVSAIDYSDSLDGLIQTQEIAERFIRDFEEKVKTPMFCDVFSEHIESIPPACGIVFTEDFSWLNIEPLENGEMKVSFNELLERVSTEKTFREVVISNTEDFIKIIDKAPKHPIVLDENAQPILDHVPSPNLRTFNITKSTSESSLNTFFAVDVETTGLSPVNDEIVQISAVRFTGFQPIDSFTSYIKPRKGINARAERINHISAEMVEDAPYIEQVMPAFLDFIGDAPIVAHNISFDFNFLTANGASFVRNKFYDTLELSRKEFDLPNYKLGTVCGEELSFVNGCAHMALADAMASGIIFCKIFKQRMNEKWNWQTILFNMPVH